MYDDLDDFMKELDLASPKKKPYRKAKRVWLNTSQSLHAFAAYDYERETYSGKVSGYGTLDIADCNKIISLDLSFRNEKSKRAVLAKLDRLAKIVAEVRLEVAETDLTEITNEDS